MASSISKLFNARTIVVQVLLLPSVTSASGDDFSNNLFSDLAPLLALFGERVTVQYLSQSLGILDDIIFAMAPLGIITAAVCAIRVAAPMWLKAVIGRSSEPLGEVERELLSSTSIDTCELWNGETIVRVPGNPSVLELLVYRGTDGRVIGVQRSQGFIDKSKKRNAKFDNALTNAENIHGSHRRDHSYVDDDDFRQFVGGHGIEMANLDSAASETEGLLHETVDDEETPHHLRMETPQAAPNISLNSRIVSAGKAEMILVAFIGVLLQCGVLVYDGFISYEFEGSHHFLTDLQEPVKPYAFPLCLAGTMLVVFGMFVCARVVERATVEETFKLDSPVLFEPEGRKAVWVDEGCELMWLQKGEIVGDQLFGSYKIKPGESKSVYLMTSRRIGDKKCITRTGHRSIFDNEEFWTLIGATVSLVGFIIQFIGLRSMHWSASIAQLLATGIMVILRIVIRRGQAAKPEIEDASKSLGLELDWLAFNLVNSDGTFQFFPLNVNAQDIVHPHGGVYGQQKPETLNNSPHPHTPITISSTSDEDDDNTEESLMPTLDLFQIRLDLQRIAPKWSLPALHLQDDQLSAFALILCKTLTVIYESEFWKGREWSSAMSSVTWNSKIAYWDLEQMPKKSPLETAQQDLDTLQNLPKPLLKPRQPCFENSRAGYFELKFKRERNIRGGWGPFELSHEEMHKLKTLFCLWIYKKEKGRPENRNYMTGLNRDRDMFLFDLWIKKVESIGAITQKATLLENTFGFACVEAEANNIVFEHSDSAFNHCALGIYSAFLYMMIRSFKPRLEIDGALSLNLKSRMDSRKSPLLLSFKGIDEIAAVMETHGHPLARTDIVQLSIISALHAAGSMPVQKIGASEINDFAKTFIRFTVGLAPGLPAGQHRLHKIEEHVEPMSRFAMRYMLLFVRRAAQTCNSLKEEALIWVNLDRTLTALSTDQTSAFFYASELENAIKCQKRVVAAKWLLDRRRELKKIAFKQQEFIKGVPKDDPKHHSDKHKLDIESIELLLECYDFPLNQVSPSTTTGVSDFDFKSPEPDCLTLIHSLEEDWDTHRFKRKGKKIKKEAKLRKIHYYKVDIEEAVKSEESQLKTFEDLLSDGVPISTCLVKFMKGFSDETIEPVSVVVAISPLIFILEKFEEDLVSLSSDENFEVLRLAIQLSSPIALQMFLQTLEFSPGDSGSLKFSQWEDLLLYAWEMLNVFSIHLLIQYCPFNPNKVFKGIRKRLGEIITSKNFYTSTVVETTSGSTTIDSFARAMEMIYVIISTGVESSNLPLTNLLASAIGKFNRNSSVAERPAFEFLISIGADINETLSEGDTLLSKAVKGQYYSSLRMLIIHQNADVNHIFISENGPESALSVACRRNDLAMIKQLLEYNAMAMEYRDPIDSDIGVAPLVAAAEGGAVDAMRLLYQEHKILETTREYFTKSPLCGAATKGQMNVIEYLLDEGYSSANEDMHGKVPPIQEEEKSIKWADYSDSVAYQAAAAGHFKIAIYLMEKGANSSRFFYLAVKHRRFDICKLFANHWSKFGNKLNLELAASGVLTSLSSLILDEYVYRKTRSSLPDKDDQPDSLEQAATDRKQFIQLLLEKGADANGYADSVPTIVLAASCGATDIATLLLDKGADINARSFAGKTFLHKLMFEVYKPPRIVRYGDGVSRDPYEDDIYDDVADHRWRPRTNDLSYGLSVGYTDGRYALLETIRENHIELAFLLVERGADINCQDYMQNSPLHECVLTAARLHLAGNIQAISKILDLMRFLLEKGADARVSNSRKRSPLAHVKLLPIFGVKGNPEWKREMMELLQGYEEAQNRAKTTSRTGIFSLRRRRVQIVEP